MITLLLILSHAIIFPEQADIYLEVTGERKVTAPWVFFAPHENEFVINDYIAKQVNDKGGQFFVLRQRGEREIVFTFQEGKTNKEVRIDPNRIFTDKGIHASIKKLNPTLDPQSSLFKHATKRANALGNFVLTQLGTNKTWLAIHNNTNGYDGDGKSGLGNVSIIRYQHKLESGAQYLIDVTQQGLVKNNIDEDDLYFVTEQKDFNAMKQAHWNAVLQNPMVTSDPNEDDGSLSVYAQMQGIRYINIEAERMAGDIGSNHLATQKNMVDYIFKLLLKTK